MVGDEFPEHCVGGGGGPGRGEHGGCLLRMRNSDSDLWNQKPGTRRTLRREENKEM